MAVKAILPRSEERVAQHTHRERESNYLLLTHHKAVNGPLNEDKDIVESGTNYLHLSRMYLGWDNWDMSFPPAAGILPQEKMVVVQALRGGGQQKRL